MILDFCPDKPGKKTSLKFLGYWHSVKIDPRSGLVLSTAFEFDRYDTLFGPCGLPVPSDFVDLGWDETERASIVTYLQAGSPYEYWKGYSFCRFGCDHTVSEQGTKDLTDGTYVWPEGFAHYVARHGVRPPAEFVQHALKTPP